MIMNLSEIESYIQQFPESIRPLLIVLVSVYAMKTLDAQDGTTTDSNTPTSVQAEAAFKPDTASLLVAQQSMKELTGRDVDIQNPKVATFARLIMIFDQIDKDVLSEAASLGFLMMHSSFLSGPDTETQVTMTSKDLGGIINPDNVSYDGDRKQLLISHAGIQQWYDISFETCDIIAWPTIVQQVRLQNGDEAHAGEVRIEIKEKAQKKEPKKEAKEKIDHAKLPFSQKEFTDYLKQNLPRLKDFNVTEQELKDILITMLRVKSLIAADYWLDEILIMMQHQDTVLNEWGRALDYTLQVENGVVFDLASTPDLDEFHEINGISLRSLKTWSFEYTWNSFRVDIVTRQRTAWGSTIQKTVGELKIQISDKK